MKTYKEAYALLLEKQRAYKFKQRQKKEGLYKKTPELFTIDREMNLLGIALTRGAIAGELSKMDKIRKEMDALEAEKLRLADDNANLLTQPYFCPLCKDQGMVDNEICQCLGQCLTETSFTIYDLKAKAQKETFESFNVNYYSNTPRNEGGTSPRENAKTIKQLMLKYCKNYETVNDQLLFIGSPGVGKTFMSNCIVNNLTPKGYGIIYVTAAHLVSSIQDQLFRSGKTSTKVFEPLLLCDLLIIDDLGAEFSSEYSQKQLYEVIDSRLNAEKKMIISTNLSLLKIQKTYDERLSSRIQGNFKTIPFMGDDIRILKARKGRS